MTRQEPPNLIYGDNCTTCKHGWASWDGDAKCEKYDCYTSRDQTCDDFERHVDE